MIKGIEQLTCLTNEHKKRLEISERNYRRFGRIYFQVLSYKGNDLIIKVWQRENVAGKYLTAAELTTRARGVFAPLFSAKTIIHVCPVPFEKMDLQNFTLQDAKREMEALSLRPTDLVRLLGLDKSSMSLMLKEDKSLTRAHRAMFYYFFKSMKQEPTSKQYQPEYA
ncbi:hypothetical protein AGMMS4956_10980 [Bacteroidia bacterium]|nr:hypothetical protein AGMMS4956_10980 [Bacteroidia bacterium]